MITAAHCSEGFQNYFVPSTTKDLVVGFSKKIFAQIALFYLIVSSIISAIWMRNRYVSTLNEKMGNVAVQEPTRALYYKQLKNLLALQSFSESPAALLRQVDQTAEELDKLVQDASVKISGLLSCLDQGRTVGDTLPLADALYKGVMGQFEKLTQEPLTPIQKALYSGELTTMFRELDDALSKKADQMLHRYCGCHVETKESDTGLKKLAPTLKPNFERKNYDKYRLEADKLPVGDFYSATLLSQSLGGGHNVVQEAMGGRISRDGGHVYKVEADLEVLDEFYQFKKWTGKTAAEWSQYLLQGSYFRTIRFVGWLSSGAKRGNIDDLVQLFAQSMLLRGRQDFSMTLFTRQAKAAEEAAYHVGQGLLDVATDLDYQLFGFENGSTNPHFKHFLMARDAEEERNLLAQLDPTQIVDGGLPVRDPFLKTYSAEELKEFKKQLGIEEEARLVLVLCGGEGIKNDCAEEIFRRYSKEGPKIHLFTVCGKNEEKRKELEKLFQTPSHIKATALGWTNADTLGKLYAIAAEERGVLVSAKAGGGTVSEAIARNVPMLVSDRTKMIYHERKNLEFIEKHRLGSTFTREIELPQKLLTMLQEEPQNRGKPLEGSIEKSMAAIQQAVQECRESQQLEFNAGQIYAGLPKAYQEVSG